VAERDYYQILNLPRDASDEDVRQSYYLALKKLDSNDFYPTKELLIVQEAYEVLSNPIKRSIFDAKNKNRSVPDEDIPGIDLQIQYSQHCLVPSKDPQLLYLLLELSSKDKVSNENLLPTHLCLVVDTSTSMKGSRIEHVKKNIIHLLKKFKPQDFISIVSFNDKASVIQRPTKISAISQIEREIQLLNCFGGTEIFNGLFAGLQQLSSLKNQNISRHLILLTDGHTYGDEKKTIELAQKAYNHQVSISVIGIGHEWNDQFMDRLAGVSGGSTVFLANDNDLEKYLTGKMDLISTLHAKKVQMEIDFNANAELRFAFRLAPEISPLPLENLLVLGQLPYNGKLKVLLEIALQEIPEHLDYIKIAQSLMKIQFVGEDDFHQKRILISRPVNFKPGNGNTPEDIVKALSRLSLYRMQEKARMEVLAGQSDSAANRLQHLATHLFAVGENKLAKQVLSEADQIIRTKHFSELGEKSLKYGTRSLILPVEFMEGEK
jgi:Ca-activated chloride channel family protein